ncbi:hypothetical protein Y032_0067g65 [Ancylostoma ceylanicum]|nr:hypothetical protein Y032_0067g65 [Ancylostoma ceylanicum]
MTPSATKSHKIGFRSRGLIQPSDSISTLSLSLTSAGNSRAGETHDGSTHTTTARGDLYPCLIAAATARIHNSSAAMSILRHFDVLAVFHRINDVIFRMQAILLVSLAVSVAFAQFAPQNPQQLQQQPYVQEQQFFRNQPARFSQYRTNTNNNGYSSSNYNNNGYNTQYGQTTYSNGYNNGYGSTTPSYYGSNSNNNQYGYTTQQYGNNRQFDQNGQWNGVATSSALMALATTAIAFAL